MTLDKKVLYDGGWVKFVELGPDNQVLVERKDGVTVLPFFRTEGEGNPFYLLHERVSGTLNPNPVLCSLTGSIDGNDSPFDTALRELREEAGLVILAKDLLPLGEAVLTYKGCTKKTWMFAADITGACEVPAQGDGSKVEAEAFCQYHSLEELLSSQDALLLATFARFIFLYPEKASQL